MKQSSTAGIISIIGQAFGKKSERDGVFTDLRIIAGVYNQQRDLKENVSFVQSNFLASSR